MSRPGLRHYNSDRMTRSRLSRIRLAAEIKAVNNDNKLRVYGSPRMTAELNARGCQCSVNAVAKLMRELGIEARRARGQLRMSAMFTLVRLYGELHSSPYRIAIRR